MARPIVGIISGNVLHNDTYPAQLTGTMNVAALAEICDVSVVSVPAVPSAAKVADLVAHFDGFMLPGARANVHPEEYGEAETPAHGDFDRDRDAVALPLIRACVDLGLPIFGICRGFQEVNVAMGGSLYPEIRDLPGRDNHRMPPDGTLEEKFALRHVVSLTDNGPFHQVFGAREVLTNTLHGQGIKVPGPRVVIDGYAPDGTPEAIYIKDAPGFTMSVQWHPEWNAGNDPVSRPLFEAFGAATHNWADRKRGRPAA